jgi:glycosyltransferase involved in cell wall biosynthesis
MISVIITAHNHEPYLPKCLKTILRDPAEKEVIVVNDASEDNTKAVVKQFPGVKYYEVDFRNANKSRNFGFAKSKGELINFFDGDDFLDGNLFAECEQFMKEYKLDFCYTPFNYAELDKIPRLACNEIEFTRSALELETNLSTVGMFKRKFFVKWDENLKCNQDWDFWLSLTKKTQNGRRLNRRLWTYRIHESQKSNIIGPEQRNKDREYIRKKHGLKNYENDELTLIIPVAREILLHRIFTWLDNAEIDRKNTHLVFLDHTESGFARKEFLKYEKKGWATCRVKCIDRNRIVEACVPRWKTIAENMNDGLKMVKTPYMACVEDDTIPPYNAIPKLFKIVKKNEDIVYAEGVELARQGEDRHVGAWDVFEENYTMTKAISKELKEKGIEEITGGGFYCFVAKTDAVKAIGFKHKFMGITTGPDIIFVYELFKNGGKCVIDWSIKCVHLQYDNNGGFEEIIPNHAVIGEKVMHKKYN